MISAIRFNGKGKKGAVFSSRPSSTARSNKLAATILGSLILEVKLPKGAQQEEPV